MSSEKFQGFPKEGLLFLKSLKNNNNRDWFLPRKGKYEALLKTPMQLLIAELASYFASRAPEIVFDHKKSVFRIYRDVRFSKDKSPYKTHIAASFNVRRDSKTEDAPGLYLHIEPGSVFIAGGLYMPSSQQLRKIRETMLREPRDFLKIINSKSFKKKFVNLKGDKLKKAPRGVDPSNAMIEFLKHKQFFVSVEYKELECLKPAFKKQVQKDFEQILPLIRWLSKAQRAW